MLLTIVTGGLAVTVFALPFIWAVVGLAVGNLVGAVFMALHAAQGPTLGVPQMIQTRGQFGSLGSLLVVGIVIVMYVGFLSSRTWSWAARPSPAWCPARPMSPASRWSAILSVIAAIYGYDLIHAYARVMTYVSGAVLLLTAAWIIWVHGLPPDFLTRNSFNLPGCSAPCRPRAVADRLRALCIRLLALHAAGHRACGRHSGRAIGAAPWVRCCRWCWAPWWGWPRRKAT